MNQINLTAHYAVTRYSSELFNPVVLSKTPAGILRWKLAVDFTNPTDAKIFAEREISNILAIGQIGSDWKSY